jgi:small subunit ribosomal protein S6
MFLFPQAATANLQEAIDHLKGILEKCGASIINFRKWDDRRLAYEVEGNKRGVYFLVYFNAPTLAISDLERRCNQSEQMLRMMVTRAEHLPTEIIEANDGAEELATEIKLRSEKKSDKSASASSTVTRKDDEAETPPAKEEPVAEEEVSVDNEETVETEEVTEA